MDVPGDLGALLGLRLHQTGEQCLPLHDQLAERILVGDALGDVALHRREGERLALVVHEEAGDRDLDRWAAPPIPEGRLPLPVAVLTDGRLLDPEEASSPSGVR